MDVASDASVARGVDQIIARAGRIDVVVNNAGASSSVRSRPSQWTRWRRC